MIPTPNAIHTLEPIAKNNFAHLKEIQHINIIKYR